MSEVAQLQTNISVKWVSSVMIELAGVLFITDERIYLQPYHSELSDRPVYSYKVRDVTEFFQLRGTLQKKGYLRLKIEKIDSMSG